MEIQFNFDIHSWVLREDTEYSPIKILKDSELLQICQVVLLRKELQF